MIERRDEELSSIYRDAEGPRPPQRVDDNILAASQRVAGARPRPAGAGFARRWGTPVALAATVLVTGTLTLMVFERESARDTTSSGAPVDRLAKVSPPEKSAAESQPLARAPVTAIPQAAAPRDRAEQRPADSAASGERLGTGQPAFVPEVPRTDEVLRKREEEKPAPAGAPAANLYSIGRAADQPATAPEARRAPEPLQQTPPVPAPSQPAGAGGLRESISAIRGTSVVGAGLAAPEAKERTPEKWLADIRLLKLEGKTTEAQRELAEFKKRYPDYRLPEDLR